MIRILGSGVSGVTTGIVLRLVGYPVTIVAERSMDGDDRPAEDPTFASMFPPASIIPNVAVDHRGWHAATARQLFGRLQQAGTAGVRTQCHYDVAEVPTPVPAWARDLDRVEELTEASGAGVPRRTGCAAVWGWSADCLFAEMPIYRRWLLDLYETLGGTFAARRRVSPEDVARFPEEVVVNCTGYGSGALFDTRDELTLVKGLLVEVLTGPADGARPVPPVSYSYAPAASVDARPSETPANVYFYPRADCWLLGGTRLAGSLDDAGRWVGEEPGGRTIDVGGVAVPAQILEVNRDLVSSLTGVDIADFEARAVVGYRCRRRAALGGLRIESETVGDKVVVHNYAHGGAGVTYSWGSAIRVARMVAAASPRPDPPAASGDTVVAGLTELVHEVLAGAP